MLKENPLISIIVPIYNGEHYLSECIKSIINQDYRNLEILLVDDGSNDNSRKIAIKFAENDSRIKLLFQTNLGVSVARNNGLEHAHGEYVCFLDQDDFFESSYISYFFKLIYRNGVDIALTPKCKRITAISHDKAKKILDDDVKIWTGKQATIQMLNYNLVIAPWNKMISRRLIETNNLRFDPRFFSGEGFLFSIECFQRAEKVAVGTKKLYCYRVDNPSSGMTKFSLNVIKSSLNAQMVIRNNILEKTNDIMKACRYSNWHTNCDCLNTMVGCKVTQKYHDMYSEIEKECQKKALVVLEAPVSRKEKLKGICYFINPFLAANIINFFRMRKFKRDVD